jgi:hypothetical protein
VSTFQHRHGFREWLVDRLMGTEAATRPLQDGGLPELAAQLGVQVDALLEARAKRAVIDAAEQRQPRMGQKVDNKHYQITVFFPEAIHQEWLTQAKARGLKGSALLRSILNAYLMGSYEPKNVLKHWHWRGCSWPCDTHRWGLEHDGPWPFTDRALLPQGARRALVIRARRIGASMTAVCRALVCETLDGKFGQPGVLEIVDAATMFDDESRYYLGPPV